MQISKKQQDAEIEFVKKLMKEAKENANKPIEDYKNASMFELQEHAKLGDEKAQEEIDIRRKF